MNGQQSVYRLVAAAFSGQCHPFTGDISINIHPGLFLYFGRQLQERCSVAHIPDAACLEQAADASLKNLQCEHAAVFDKI